MIMSMGEASGCHEVPDASRVIGKLIGSANASDVKRDMKRIDVTIFFIDDLFTCR